MVSPLNPLKHQEDLLDDDIRLDLARQALKGEPHIVVSDYEMHLPRPSYTWLTLQSLERDYPDCRFTLLIGGDNWASFHLWYHADDILNNYDVCVYPRSERRREGTGVQGNKGTVVRGNENASATDYPRTPVPLCPRTPESRTPSSSRPNCWTCRAPRYVGACVPASRLRAWCHRN